MLQNDTYTFSTQTGLVHISVGKNSELKISVKDHLFLERLLTAYKKRIPVTFGDSSPAKVFYSSKETRTGIVAGVLAADPTAKVIEAPSEVFEFVQQSTFVS